MKTVCNHCGMESDKPDICTWCGKDIESQPAAKAQEAQAPAKPAPKKGRRLAKTYASTEPRKSFLPSWAPYLAPLIIAIIGMFVWSALKARAVQTPPKEPADWQAFTSQNGNLKLRVPAGWKTTTSGSQGTFEKVTVRYNDLTYVSIEGTQGKGSISDIAGAAARVSAPAEGGEQELALKAEGRLHSFLGEVEVKKDPSYKEEGDMMPAVFGSKPAAMSQYTTMRSAGLFKVNMKGIRMSAPGGDYGWDIRVVAPEKCFDAVLPIASQIVASVQVVK